MSWRFSNTVETGVRIPRKIHAPLRFPGMLSTAGHWDQSRVAVAVIRTPVLRVRKELGPKRKKRVTAAPGRGGSVRRRRPRGRFGDQERLRREPLARGGPRRA